MPQPNFDRAYDLANRCEISLQETFSLAAHISITDGVYTLPCDPDRALAGMFVIGDAIWPLHPDGKYEQWFACLGAYNRIRDALEAIFPEAGCYVTDPWTFDTYSDLHKDDYGFRPHDSLTGPEVRKWIDARSKSQRRERLQDHAEDLAGL